MNLRSWALALLAFSAALVFATPVAFAATTCTGTNPQVCTTPNPSPGGVPIFNFGQSKDFGFDLFIDLYEDQGVPSADGHSSLSGIKTDVLTTHNAGSPAYGQITANEVTQNDTSQGNFIGVTFVNQPAVLNQLCQDVDASLGPNLTNAVAVDPNATESTGSAGGTSGRSEIAWCPAGSSGNICGSANSLPTWLWEKTDSSLTHPSGVLTYLDSLSCTSYALPSQNLWTSVDGPVATQTKPNPLYGFPGQPQTITYYYYPQTKTTTITLGQTINLNWSNSERDNIFTPIGGTGGSTSLETQCTMSGPGFTIPTHTQNVCTSVHQNSISYQWECVNSAHEITYTAPTASAFRDINYQPGYQNLLNSCGNGCSTNAFPYGGWPASDFTNSYPPSYSQQAGISQESSSNPPPSYALSYTPTSAGQYTYDYTCTNPNGTTDDVVTVNVLAPSDLTAGAVAPTAATTGTATTFSTTISNGGTGTTNSGFINLLQRADSYDSGTDTATNVQDVATDTVAALGASPASEAASFSYTFPSADENTTRYLRVCADKSSGTDTGTIPEWNAQGTGEGNNCGAWTPITVTPPAPVPTLSASPSSINVDLSSTLTYSCANSTSGSINNSVGSITADGGTYTTQVTPSSTTTYTLTCIGDGGTKTASATVTVLQPVATFSAVPPTIDSGGTSALTYSCANSGSASINNGIGSVTADGNTHTVSTPALTSFTTYTLSCFSVHGTEANQKSASVTVQAPNASLAASPSSISSGASTSLVYTCTNATSGSIDNGIGSVTADGTQHSKTTPALTTSTTYTLTCTNEYGKTATKTATVTVNAPLTVSCSVSPTSGTTNTTFVWTATASGGSGSGYTYTWGGSSPLSGKTGSSASVQYSAGGPYTGSVTVYDSSGSSYGPASCSNSVSNVTGPPDLTATTSVSYAGTVTAGTATSYSQIVGNAAHTAATGSTFPVLFQWARTSAGAGATNLCTTTGTCASGAALGAGYTQETSSAFSYSTSSPGTFYIRACANTVNNSTFSPVGETVTTNNCGAWTKVVVVPAGYPDLTATTSVSHTGTVTAGTAASYNEVIGNIGAAATGSTFPVLFQWARTSAGAGATNLCTTTGTCASGAALGAGYTQETSSAFSYSTSSPGTFYIRACANTVNNSTFSPVGENGLTSNNCGVWTQVTVTPAPQPDLTSDSVTVSLSGGDLYSFASHINNVGTASVVSTTFPNLFELYQGSSPPTLFSQLTHTYTISKSGAAVGTPVTITKTPVTGLSQGTWWVRLCADTDAQNNTDTPLSPDGVNYQGVIAESSETNNCSTAWTQFAVGNPQVTCYVSPPSPGDTTTYFTYTQSYSGFVQTPDTFSWNVSGGTPASGSSASFTTYYKNTGTYVATVHVSNSSSGENASATCPSVTVNPPAPTCPTLSTSQTDIDAGQSVALTWSCQNAGSCTAIANADGFSTGNAKSGTDNSVTPSAPSGQVTYGMTCGGSTFYFPTITVHKPTAQVSADPLRIASNGSTKVGGTGTDINTGCTITDESGVTLGTCTPDAGHTCTVATTTVSNITKQKIFTMSCDSGAAHDSVTVNITPSFQNF